MGLGARVRVRVWVIRVRVRARVRVRSGLGSVSAPAAHVRSACNSILGPTLRGVRGRATATT